MKRKYKN